MSEVVDQYYAGYPYTTTHRSSKLEIIITHKQLVDN
jgi:hypothetical protein